VLVLGCASAPTNTPTLTVVTTPEGPVRVVSPKTLNPLQLRQCALEVSEGYAEGRVWWGPVLPTTHTFIVQVERDHNFYTPYTATITVEPDFAALSNGLQNHFCHWAQAHALLSPFYDCAHYWKYRTVT